MTLIRIELLSLGYNTWWVKVDSTVVMYRRVVIQMRRNQSLAQLRHFYSSFFYFYLCVCMWICI